MELSVLKLRVLIAIYSEPGSALTRTSLEDVIMKELRQLFGSASPWVIALGHYLKTIFEYHRDPTLLATTQIDTAIRALEGTGLHHYARTARILRGKALGTGLW